jgi:predicted amino acid-binding ACT domain protein
MSRSALTEITVGGDDDIGLVARVTTTITSFDCIGGNVTLEFAN